MVEADWLSTYNIKTADKYWLYYPPALVHNGNWYRIIPSSNMTIAQVFNSLTLLVLYVSIIFIIVTRKITCVWIPIISLVLITILYWIFSQTRRQELRQNLRRNLRRRSDLNPSPNPNPKINTNSNLQPRNNPPRISHIEAFSKDLSSPIIHDINMKLHRRSIDIPQTIRTNDNQSDFARWLYMTPETCKENTARCGLYEDVRYTRSNPDLDKSLG